MSQSDRIRLFSIFPHRKPGREDFGRRRWLVVSLTVAALVLTAGDCNEEDPVAGGKALEIPPDDPWGFIDNLAAQGEWDKLARAAEGAADDADAPISRDAALAVYAAALSQLDTEEAAAQLSEIKEEVEAIDGSQLPEQAVPWLEQARNAVAPLTSGELAPESP